MREEQAVLASCCCSKKHVPGRPQDDLAEGGKDSLYVSDEDTLKIRADISSGKPKEECIQMMAEMR